MDIVESEEVPLIQVLPLVYRLVMGNTDPHRHGFTKSQFLVLAVLYRRGSLHMTQIAEYLSSAKEQASRVVSPLAEAGLVERSIDPENRTRVCVSLTEKGRESIDRYIAEMKRRINDKLGCLEESDRTELFTAAASMVTILSKLA